MLRHGNRCAIAGLAFLAVAIAGTVLLVADVVVGAVWAGVLAGAIALVIAGLWFLAPFLLPSDEKDEKTVSAGRLPVPSGRPHHPTTETPGDT